MSPAVAITTLGLLTNTTTTLYQHSTTHHSITLDHCCWLDQKLLLYPVTSLNLLTLLHLSLLSLSFNSFTALLLWGGQRDFCFLCFFLAHFSIFTFMVKFLYGSFRLFFLLLLFCPGQVTVLVADPSILLFIGNMSPEIAGTSFLPT